MRILVCFLGSGAAILLAGCVSLDATVPPVTPALAAAVKTDQGMLEQGRVIYTTRCTDCHNASAVSAHSKDEWPGIIRRMAPESELDPMEERAVLAYVMALAR